MTSQPSGAASSAAELDPGSAVERRRHPPHRAGRRASGGRGSVRRHRQAHGSTPGVAAGGPMASRQAVSRVISVQACVQASKSVQIVAAGRRGRSPSACSSSRRP